MSKWFDPKIFSPPLDRPFLAYINFVHVQETFDPEKPEFIPDTKIISAVMDRENNICDLFSYYENNVTYYEYKYLIAWKRFPKRPKKLSKL